MIHTFGLVDVLYIWPLASRTELTQPLMDHMAAPASAATPAISRKKSVLALISKVAPAGMLSMIMGVWFAATLPGDILAGWLGGFWMTIAKTDFFLLIAGVAALAGIAIWCISGWVSSVLDAKTDM